MENTEEARERRCPRLGGDVTFRYCLSCGEKRSICFKILDCWWEYFDVAGLLRAPPGQAPRKGIGSSPRNHFKGKVFSLLEAVDMAKKRLTRSSSP